MLITDKCTENKIKKDMSSIFPSPSTKFKSNAATMVKVSFLSLIAVLSAQYSDAFSFPHTHSHTNGRVLTELNANKNSDIAARFFGGSATFLVGLVSAAHIASADIGTSSSIVSSGECPQI